MITLDFMRTLARNNMHECWQWEGTHSEHGYALISKRLLHRIMYQLLIGPIPDNLVLHHKCGNKGCVNPYHCQLIHQREHAAIIGFPHKRMTPRTHCKHGHVLEGYNVMLRNGARTCRACHNQKTRDAKRKARKGGE